MKAAFFSVATVDFFHQARRYVPGGNALNQAVRFARLGWDAAFVGAVGTDEAGDSVETLLRSSGVDTSLLYRVEGSTAANEIENDEYGERFGVDGAWNAGVYEGFRLSDSDWNTIRSCDIWSTHADCPDFARAAAEKDGQFLTVDFQHRTNYQEVLDGVDIAYFGGRLGQEDGLLELSKSSEALLVLTLGREGSLAFRHGLTFRQAALPVDKVVDTTGCGDAFQAAFTACYYDCGDIRRALKEGAIAGRDATQNYGGTS